MRRYPEVYAAVKASIEKDIQDGILSADRLNPCTELTYSRCLTAIKLGLRTPEDVICDYAI